MGKLRVPWARLFALSESYPDLKANQNMLALQEELTSTENKVAFARQSFNDAVMSYNHAGGAIPGVAHRRHRRLLPGAALRA